MLARSQSVSSFTTQPSLTRHRSVNDLTAHVRSSQRYKPHWPTQYSTHAYKDWEYDLGRDYYFWDKSWYRLFHLDRHPVKWTYPYNFYRATFRNYAFNTNYPYYRYLSPYFNSYYTYGMYRPYIHDVY